MPNLEVREELFGDGNFARSYFHRRSGEPAEKDLSEIFWRRGCGVVGGEMLPDWPRDDVGKVIGKTFFSSVHWGRTVVDVRGHN